MSRRGDALRTRLRLLIRSAAGQAYGLRRIRRTSRLEYPEAEFSVHMLLCHRHVDMGLWCLQSLLYFAGLAPRVWVHDDGSLTAADIGLLETRIARCSVVRRREADRRMERALAEHPHCRAMRRKPEFVCALKLFDPWQHSTAKTVVLVDSDVLFFRRPSELLECAARGHARHLADYQDAYAVAPEEIAARLSVDVQPRVNAGLLVLGREDYRLDLIERYFAAFPDPVTDPNRHEQTLYAILLARASARAFGDAYQISRQPITDATVSHHFVDDGSRLGFTTRGIKRLQRNGMLRALR